MDDSPDPPIQQHLGLDHTTVEGGQIGGQAGRDITQHQGKGHLFKDVTVNVFQPTGATSALGPQDYRNRQILLNKVSYYWVDQALEPALSHPLQLTIELGDRSAAVDHPLADLGGGGQLSPAVTQGTLGTVFDRLGDGRTLLVLGATGVRQNHCAAPARSPVD